MKMHLRAVLVASLALAVVATPAVASSPLAAGTIGAPGVGDPFFPLAGNGGINVVDYNLDLAYNPTVRQLDGTATVRVLATQDLSRFDLDLRGFQVGTVTVDGKPASTVRDGQELVITPSRTIRKGSAFTVVVPYAGVPETIVDPDGSSEGWVYTDDGAVVVGEPQGSPGWYPVNDTPRDKATFTVKMTVPKGLTAVGNGSLLHQSTSGGHTTFTWRERFPMAPYLSTITLGRFDVSKGRTASGIPIYVAVDPTQKSAADPVLRKLPAMVSFLEGLYGRYPFETVGGIVDNAPELGYSLETQTKPVFDAAPDELTLLHELSHMWYGDAVTLTTWPDIWLHEGFATWSEWIWTERQGGQTAAERFQELASTPAGQSSFWNPPPGAPGDPAHLFDGTIYDRGAMTLEALRERIGDPRFFTVMRRWYAEHRYGNVTTPEFIALAEKVSGQHLGRFFNVWLYQPGKPAVLAGATAMAGPMAMARATAGATATPQRR
jgi:aminopeptidase N